MLIKCDVNPNISIITLSANDLILKLKGMEIDKMNKGSPTNMMSKRN